jgi:hypothetical protein
MRFVRMSQELIPISPVFQKPNLDRSDAEAPQMGYNLFDYLRIQRMAAVAGRISATSTQLVGYSPV